MNKIQALFKLKGKTKEENYLVKEEKIRYLFNRIRRVFKKIPYFTMGETLEKPIIAINSYGLFSCRRRTYDLHIISDSYEFYLRKLFEKLSKKAKVLVDVGAHIGKYAILASKLNPHAKVFAVEPGKENFKFLSKNKTLNELNNLKIIKLALHNKKGKVKLYLGEVNTGGQGIEGFVPNSNKFEVVRQDTFDNVFGKKLDKIDLVKIDTEGNESEILKGAHNFLYNKKIKNIIFELNGQETKKLLESYGYSCKKIQSNNYLASIK